MEQEAFIFRFSLFLRRHYRESNHSVLDESFYLWSDPSEFEVLVRQFEREMTQEHLIKLLQDVMIDDIVRRRFVRFQNFSYYFFCVNLQIVNCFVDFLNFKDPMAIPHQNDIPVIFIGSSVYEQFTTKGFYEEKRPRQVCFVLLIAWMIDFTHDFALCKSHVTSEADAPFWLSFRCVCRAFAKWITLCVLFRQFSRQDHHGLRPSRSIPQWCRPS